MRCLASSIVLVAVAAAVPALAQTGEQGSVCVHDFSPGVECSGTDVLVEAVVLDTVVEDCGIDATAQVVLDVVLSAGLASRYDVGMIVALDGNSALTGAQCYHDYLAAPLSTSPTYGDDYANGIPDLRNGPWYNAEPFDMNDTCGDIQGNTEVIKSLRTASLPLTIDCEDTNHDGTVDVSVCASWRVGTTGGQATCNALNEAVPSSSERCSCDRVEILPEPTAALSLACGAALIALTGRIRRA